MPATAKPSTRNAEATRARIVEAAQQVFSRKSYGQAGLREIADLAGVAGSLVIKYFGTKAALFELALTRSLVDPRVYQQDRSRFGAHMVGVIDDPGHDAFQPAMIALAIGDDEAKDIIGRVSQDHIVKPMAAWLGGTDAEARASYILMLTMGYVFFTRQVSVVGSDEARRVTANLVAKKIQAAVDGADLVQGDIGS